MFLIQSLPRCGTHLTRTALQSHGEIVCYGEVFNIHSRVHGYPTHFPAVGEVITDCRSRGQQTGFVAHAYVGLAEDETGPGLDESFRCRQEVQAAQGLWKAIPPQTAVITLYRSNLLERFVSLLVAQSRRSYLACDGEPTPAHVRVHVDPNSMLIDFARTETLMAIAMSRFPNALRISYEELAAAPDAAFNRMQTHLDVKVKRLRPRTIKTGRSLRETISNYGETRRILCRTEYEKFLEPD